MFIAKIGINLFSHRSDGGWTIIGRHPPKSSAWTWSLGVRFGRHDQRIGPFSIPHKLRFGDCGLTLPYVDIRLQRQERRPRMTPAEIRGRVLEMADGVKRGAASYWCLFCGRKLWANTDGVFVHDDVPHPTHASYDEDRVSH